MGIAHREERSDFIDIQQKACGSVTFLVRGTLFSLPGWSTGRLYNIYFKGSRMERTYQAYGLTNYRNIRQITRLNKEELQAIEVVGRVLPFHVVKCYRKSIFQSLVNYWLKRSEKKNL